MDRVAGILTRYSMLPQGGRIGVAVSGGADSVVLLHILHRLRPRFAMELTVLHVNHGLRGAESDEDEAFVRELAATLGVRAISERISPGEGNLEQAARDARRDFFSRVRGRVPLDRIALGHTRSDQAETVLYRLLRGSGTAGMAGMRFVTAEGLIRPLLAASRQEVREWARSEGIGWREDSTNTDTRFVRNRLRSDVIPSLVRDFNPNLEAILAGTAALAQSEEGYWEREVSTVYEQITERTRLGSIFQVERLQQLHPAVLRRVIRRAIREIRGSLRGIDLQHVEAILALCDSLEGHDRVIVPGVDALRSFDTLLLAVPGRVNEEKRHYRAELAAGEWAELPFHSGAICLAEAAPKSQNCVNFKKEQYSPTEFADLSKEALESCAGVRGLYVRNWEPGDELLRPGHTAAEKIKTLFQEHRILLWERRHWPVVVCGDEIVWSRRFGCAARFRAHPGSSGIVRLTYRESVSSTKV